MHFVGYIVLPVPLPSKYILRLFKYQFISSKTWGRIAVTEHFSLSRITVSHI